MLGSKLRDPCTTPCLNLVVERRAGPEAPANGKPATGTASRPTIGFLPRLRVCTTLPHRNPVKAEFTSSDGRVSTTIHGPARSGLPLGVNAKLILIHLSPGAVFEK